MRLGTMLLRDGVITLTQLEQSLRAQVLSGGRLGTNLVELGFVDLNTLSRYLARVLDTPLAIADRFEKADPSLIESFGAEMADRYSAIPLNINPEDPNTVFVALCNPTDYKAISAIEGHLKLRVSPLVVAELRLYYYLERYYSIRRRTRFTRSPDAEDNPVASRRERRATQPFRGLSSPTVVSIAPRQHRESQAQDPTPKPSKLRSYAETCDLIDAAESREAIADGLLQYTIGRFECAAIFIVRSQHAIGWRALAPGLGQDALTRLNIPLAGSSVFQHVHDSGKAYNGRVLSPGHPVEKELWSHFAIEHEPSDLHVAPISVNERIINLVYAHGFVEHPTPEKQHEELCQLAKRAGHAYGRLLARSAQEQ